MEHDSAGIGFPRISHFFRLGDVRPISTHTLTPPPPPCFYINALIENSTRSKSWVVCCTHSIHTWKIIG